MGLNIGQIPAAVAGLRSSPEFGRVRLREDRAASVPRSGDPDEPPSLGFGNRGEAQTRAGFGDGTLSPQGAALRTINRTVEAVRKAQPSLNELRARFQAHAAEERRAARAAEVVDFGRRPAEADAPEPQPRSAPQRIERRIPEASGQARRFITEVNSAAAQAFERSGGTPPQARESGPTVQIRGERFAFGNSEDRPRIDVRV